MTLSSDSPRILIVWRIYMVAWFAAILTGCSPYSPRPYYQPDWDAQNSAVILGDIADLNSWSKDDPGINDCKSSYFELPGQSSKKLHTAYISPGRACVVVSTVVWSAIKDFTAGTILLCKRAYCSYVEISSNEICFDAKRDHSYRVGLETSKECSTHRDDYHFYIQEDPTGLIIHGNEPKKRGSNRAE